MDCHKTQTHLKSLFFQDNPQLQEHVTGEETVNELPSNAESFFIGTFYVGAVWKEQHGGSSRESFAFALIGCVIWDSGSGVKLPEEEKEEDEEEAWEAGAPVWGDGPQRSHKSENPLVQIRTVRLPQWSF